MSTSSGAPLRDVSIVFGSSPFKEMARTNESGHFTLKESCETSSYAVTKINYISHRLEGGRQPDVRPLLIRLDDVGLVLSLVYNYV